MKEGVWNRLKTKAKERFRIVVLSDDSFKERFSFRFTPLTFISIIIVSMVLLIALTSVIIAFTPLREYIPGYGSGYSKEQVRRLSQRMDSLTLVIDQYGNYEKSIKAVVLGVVDSPDSIFVEDAKQSEKIVKDSVLKMSKFDSLLMKINMVGNTHKEEVSVQTVASNNTDKILLFAPAKGRIVSDKQHEGVDISCSASSSVFASKSGSVIQVGRVNDKYICILQHPNNIITIYQLATMPMVKVGQVVRERQAIAILDKEQIVHFELWIEGNSVDPQEYIIF